MPNQTRYPLVSLCRAFAVWAIILLLAYPAAALTIYGAVNA